jgi:hypothetical protein
MAEEESDTGSGAVGERGKVKAATPRDSQLRFNSGVLKVINEDGTFEVALSKNHSAEHKKVAEETASLGAKGGPGMLTIYADKKTTCGEVASAFKLLNGVDFAKHVRITGVF